ncbi:hypothetical protein HBE96_20530 [Clostridium sp. P21]|uniref:Uncharacterized protein n=1 Tax=Clostridium muellerianum TaxID=2716538 RepID=A0A7Y0HQ92_9CLOT|nr:hypothetical protein [Clostridium muellerianum]NMM64980.1 hypothetical protein [Clostridium muellerianum]
MVKINLKLNQGSPQYSCSSCMDCQSVFGKSLCSIKNRGCCWYFPKFTLYEIHKMVKEEDGLKALSKIINLPKVKIYNYYIHAKGYFDEVGYKKYIKTWHVHDSYVKDKSVFFRACPFVISGVGCTLPERYRSYVCNFFICDEIAKKAESYDEFKNYINERNSYAGWIQWENLSLEEFFTEKKLNLVENFEEIISILKKVPLREYEFKRLDPIVVLEKPNNNVNKKLG